MRGRQLLVIGLVMMASTWPLAAPQQPRDAGVLFQSALYKEQVELKLEEAIAGYKEVVSAAGGNKAVAAKALLQMAGCYERLGQAEARATYQRVVTDYADSGAVAEAARARLAAMDQRLPELTVRKVWNRRGQHVSADGRFLTFIDANEDLGVHDLASGEDRALTGIARGAETAGTRADGGLPSPDGRSVAYSWFTDKQRYEVRIIGINGGQSRVLHAGQGARDTVYPLGWTPDGKWILVRRGVDSGSGPQEQFILIPVAGGPPRVVATRVDRFGGDVRMSPDGTRVAYSRAIRTDQRERDLFSLSLADGRETLLLDHFADDYVLDWLPDGSGLLFASDRGGTFGIWATRVTDGAAVGHPIPIQSATGRIESAGFAGKGEFYYSGGVLDLDVHVATIDPKTGRQAGQLTRLGARVNGEKSLAAWAPDGTKMVWIEPLSPVGAYGIVQVREFTLVVGTIATGDVTKLRLPFQFMDWPVWHPDGRHVLVSATDLQNRYGLFSVALDGTITNIGVNTREGAVSRDGRRIFLLRRSAPVGRPASIRILVRDVAGGEEQELVSDSDGSFTLSPDGEWFAMNRRPGTGNSPLTIFPSSGGAERPLSADISGWTIPTRPAWSRDTRFLFVVREQGPANEVWRVPLDGGSPTDTGIRWTGRIRRIDADPREAGRLALSASSVSNETWVLSNLPQMREK
jgi:Tol biopolymer transport system component